jgi:hypothetical protein
VPSAGDSQALNRYIYVLNNPKEYTDASGHSNIQCRGGGYGLGWKKTKYLYASIRLHTYNKALTNNRKLFLP